MIHVVQTSSNVAVDAAFQNDGIAMEITIVVTNQMKEDAVS